MMATAGLSYEELQMRKKLLLEELQNTGNELLTRNEVQGAMDIHHPERSPGWKPYRHQEYPKMLYHPVKLDPAIEAKRLSIRRRNEANPTYAPLDLPASEPLKVIAKNKDEEEKFLAQGYAKLPPQLKTAEDEAALRDPLAESIPDEPKKGKVK
jgi:hypothetical protein